MAYYCATPVAKKLFEDKDMLIKYGVMIILTVINATNSSLILKVYISTRPKTMVRPTNVMSVMNLKQEKQLVLVISVVCVMPSLKLPLNLKIILVCMNKGEFRSRPISTFVYIFALSQSECVKRFIT